MTPAPTFQTVALKRGRHTDPRHGVCVMELASMLAGEPFSDRPATACPVIAGFLRGYNDRCANDRRQDLYATASLVVDTRADRATERLRLCRIVEAADGMRRVRLRRTRVPADASGLVVDRLTARAAHLFARRHAAGHDAALALVRELTAVTPAPSRNGVGRGPDHPRHTGAAHAPHRV